MKKYKKWSEEEIKFLKENYRDMTYTEIAEYLGRSKRAVYSKARRLGLTSERLPKYLKFLKRCAREVRK